MCVLKASFLIGSSGGVVAFAMRYIYVFETLLPCPAYPSLIIKCSVTMTAIGPPDIGRDQQGAIWIFSLLYYTGEPHRCIIITQAPDSILPATGEACTPVLLHQRLLYMYAPTKEQRLLPQGFQTNIPVGLPVVLCQLFQCDHALR